ncbi:alkaline phosphatase D family protein [Salinicola peritrichatus]|uniref:alkaline phosphatase D family protein n=1 Tax=Salinicola peritrichatus TaxID=1267424 RepID=UPI000DA13B50|nr:alkaline phosphatase D family protein [Salinicola peritrichatus]
MTATLPDILAGPIVRRAESRRLVLWLVASRPLALRLTLQADATARSHDLEAATIRLACGTHAHLHLIDLALEIPLPRDARIGYDLAYRDAAGAWRSIRDWGEALCYPGEALPSLVLRSRHDDLLHGSCRKPHHASPDGLVRADRWLRERHADASQRPAALLLTGDQIYADDVAGPMLAAIHALIERLGLFDECLEGTEIANGRELYASDKTYYRRDELLPAVKSTEALRERFFGGVRKPVFTTANAENHLITFAELLAMYLLVWSPTPWRLIAPEEPTLDAGQRERYRAERHHIDAFVEGLPGVARVLAHLPTLMIFDDHDITDDWNLNAAWEAVVYEHPFSRRIVGNALIAYLLCQGWGNDPDGLAEPLVRSQRWLASVDADGRLDCNAHDELITRLLRFTGWGYVLDSTPRLVVLDTRTRRWRSERRRQRPSGLMDWEALSEFQQELLEHPSVIIVSPAPIFGVKLIEGIQRIFTWFGKPLLVDAENWMAHPGAAHTMLNILRHSRTPQRYVILSGDVHYSFVYAITIRQRNNSPRMWQITSSGLKNRFPDTLLDWFDRLNRWLYAPFSPLNWLTKRRRMLVEPYRPSRAARGERLWNRAGIGHVRLDAEGKPQQVTQLGADDVDTHFTREER